MPTTTASLDDSLYNFILSLAIGAEVSVPRMYNYFVHAKDLRGAASKVWRSTVRGQIADAEVMSELADIVDAEMTDSKVEIALDTIGRSILLAMELEAVSPFPEIILAGQQVTNACRNKIDDLLWTDTVPGLTNISGDNATPMTFPQHISFGMEAAAQWKDNPPAGSVMRCAMHSGPFRALVNDMVTSNATIFAATFGSDNVAQVIASANNGGMKNIAGIETFVTDKIPVADASGRGNVYSLVGSEQGSAFGLAVKVGITGEVRGTEKKLARRALAYAYIGLGILRDEYALVGVTAPN